MAIWSNWVDFCHYHFGQQKHLKIHNRGCKWVKFLFYHFCIIKAIFNRLNLRLSQKITHLDTFLDKLCSSWPWKRGFAPKKHTVDSSADLRKNSSSQLNNQQSTILILGKHPWCRWSPLFQRRVRKCQFQKEWRWIPC